MSEGDLKKDITGYLCKSRHFPLRTLHRNLAPETDKIFSELKTQIPKPPLHEQVSQDCISDDTWASIDSRITVRQEGAEQTVRKLSWWICAGLSTDRKRRAEEEGRTIKSLFTSEPPLVREAWVHMCGWYKDAANRPPVRAYIPGDPDGGTCRALCHVPPSGRNIPIKVVPFPVYDNIPGEEDIAEAVTQIWLHRAGIPLGMKAKHLRMWLRAAKREEKSTPGSWDKFIAII